jgi:hypothetical protein
MNNDLRILLGDAADSYTDAQIDLCIRLAIGEVEAYCNRELDKELEYAAMMIAKIKLNRLNTEGLTSQGFSGTSESYIDGYPAEVLAMLNRKRKIKLV